MAGTGGYKEYEAILVDTGGKARWTNIGGVGVTLFMSSFERTLKESGHQPSDRSKGGALTVDPLAYRKVLDRTRSEKDRIELIRAQRVWIARRDAECRRLVNPTPEMVWQTKARLTEQRIGELQRILARLQDPAPVTDVPRGGSLPPETSATVTDVPWGRSVPVETWE